MSKKLIIAEKPSVAADIARALGGFTPYPVRSAIQHFPDDFRRAKRLLPAVLQGRACREER